MFDKLDITLPPLARHIDAGSDTPSQSSADEEPTLLRPVFTDGSTSMHSLTSLTDFNVLLLILPPPERPSFRRSSTSFLQK